MAPQRVVWLDYVRAFAILAVILCHATEAIYPLEVATVAARGLPSQIIEFVFFSIGRLGVPLFLFMTGYLMLDREYDRAVCVKFWRTKWCGLLLATEIWIVIYVVFLTLVGGYELSLYRLVKTMLFLETVPMGHIWYMPMIIGLYLFLPFMANGLKRLNDARLLAFPLGVILLITFVTPVTNVIAAGRGDETFAFGIWTGFSGGIYGCYMLLGYCVKKRAFSALPKGLPTLGFIAAFALVVIVQLDGYAHGVRAAVWYDSGLLLLAGLCLFLMFSRSRTLRKRRIVSVLSYYSFALYLVHFPVKILLTPLVGKLGISSFSLQVIILSVLVLVVSLLACVLIARIPKVGGKILYMR